MGHHLICRTTSANGGTNRYPIQIVIFIYMTVNISTTVSLFRWLCFVCMVIYFLTVVFH